MRLVEIAELFKTIDIDAEWETSEHFKNVSLMGQNGNYDYETSGNDNSRARFKRGVYRHMVEIDGELLVLYVGKSEGSTSSIAARQTRHLRSYRDPEFTGESSGKKYRQFMEEYNISDLIISIDYVDMTHMPVAMIPMFERASIDYFLPMLNQ